MGMNRLEKSALEYFFRIKRYFFCNHFSSECPLKNFNEESVLDFPSLELSDGSYLSRESSLITFQMCKIWKVLLRFLFLKTLKSDTY